ncbi:MAG: DUF1667 domain-containing protein [Solobacterium sp.]|nr:DUF1667 domain-containing protein [Solobacterium sp.]
MKKMICIICPNGCELEIDDTERVTGNLCPKGRQFALQELKDPRRSVSTTCRTVFPDLPVVPVRTEQEIPKHLMKDAVRAISEIVIDRHMRIGETVAENILNTGVNVILCTDRLKEVNHD